jgi:hypothetical protein
MHTPREPKELNEVERLLSNIRPSSDGLHTDAMLFAAGLAAGKGRKAPPVYPVLCGVLMLTVAGLACWGLAERNELMQIARNQPQNDRSPSVAVVRELEPAKSIYEPSAEDYLSLRREMEADPNRFLVAQAAVISQPADAPPPPARILTAGQRSGIPD